MRKSLLTFIALGLLAGMYACHRDNIEKAHKLVEEKGDKIEVAEILVSDTIIVDSLDSIHMQLLDECLDYLKRMPEQLEPEVDAKITRIIVDKMNYNMDTQSTTVGGELVDNPDSEKESSTPDEEE